MTKTENKNWIFWLIIFGFFSISVYALRSVLLPFVAGIIIGYLLDPLVTKFEKMKLTKQTANEVKCPLVGESPISIECRVTDIVELGTHDNDFTHIAPKVDSTISIRNTITTTYSATIIIMEYMKCI